MLNSHQSNFALSSFISDESFARRYSMPLGDVLDLCVQGLFVGASYSPSKRRWFIPVPVRISSHG